MVSLLILAVVGGWVALWVYVFRHAPNRGVRIGAVLVAVLVPFWDLPIGYMHFQSECKSEGGLRILGSINAQRAVCTEASFGDAPQWLMKGGFDVVEFRSGEKTIRYTRGNGEIHASSVGSLVSRYCMAIKQDGRPEWNTYRRDLIVRDVEAETVVAQFTSFNWRGSWLIPTGTPNEGTRCHEFKGDELIPLIRDGISK